MFNVRVLVPSPFIFEIYMEEEFEQVWNALVENGTSKRNKDATKRFWDTLTPAQKHQAYLSITQKVRENKFVQYDPIRAIKENIRMHQMVEPKDYNGNAAIEKLMKTTRLVVAKYGKGSGIYTLADAEAFRMEVLRGFNFDYNAYVAANMRQKGTTKR